MCKSKKIFSDLIYSLAGILIFNGVLQLFLYPRLHQYFGNIEYGRILFLISLITVFANSFGTAVDNVRLTMRSEVNFEQGDYNLTLLIFSIITVISLILFSWNFDRRLLISLISLAAIMLIRCYAVVIYRLEIDYRGYFFFFACLSAGYAAGGYFLRFFNNWSIAFILGEAAALGFAIFGKKLFIKPFFRCRNFKIFFKNSSYLSLSELLYNLMLNLDRLLLIFIIDPCANTQFYVASLVAKTPVFLVQPVNNLILSYLTQKQQHLNLKNFSGISILIAAASFITFGICRISSPYFIKIFYPAEFIHTENLLTIVCAGQIILFAGNISLVLLLTFSDSKTQFYIQFIYCAIFLHTSICFTLTYGIIGFAWAYLIANSLRYIITLSAGIYLLLSNKRCLWKN